MKLASPHSDRECLMAVTGRAPLELVHDACVLRDQREMACTAGGPPTVPTRRNRRRPTRPGLSVWRRLVLAWTRIAASIRRTA